MPPTSNETTQPDDFAYDVFTSYSHDDRAWVDATLLPMLEQAGLRVCIDYRDLIPGVSWIDEIERGVLTARRTVLVLTPAYLASAWAEFGGLMIQWIGLTNRELRLIPLIKEACDLPARLDMLISVDFTDEGDGEIATRQLLTALGASPAMEAPETPTPANWLLAQPYAMPPNFTGRVAERHMLTTWLDDDAAHPLLVLRTLGGFGKSALGWHWLTHDVDARRWPRVVWWSFYETDASFESFLARTLVYVGIDPHNLNPRQQIETLLHVLTQPGTLLILDGFERQLRAFSGLNAAYQGDDTADADAARDCVSPLAEAFLRSVAVLPGLRGKVLMTTRLTPRVLEQHGSMLHGCCEEELTQLAPADTVAFFRAQGIRGSRAELEQAGSTLRLSPVEPAPAGRACAARPARTGRCARRAAAGCERRSCPAPTSRA